MMTVVMFDIPRLGHHPIEPIAHTLPSSTNGELEPIPTTLVGVAFIIPPMTSVVRNHCPPGKGKCRQRHNGDDANTESHGKHSHQSAHVTPHDHFLEVSNVSVALVLFEFISELFHVGGEAVEVEGFDPLIGLGELGSRVFGDAHDVMMMM
jgi:hypothetical protein